MARLSKAYQAVYKSIVDSRRINAVSDGAEALYFRLLCVSDDFGRFHGSAFRVAAGALAARFEANSVTVEQVEERLRELERVGAVERYEVEGERFLAIVGYSDPIAADRRVARFPTPPERSSAPSGASVAPTGASMAPGGDTCGTSCPPRAGARVGVGVTVGVRVGGGAEPPPHTDDLPPPAPRAGPGCTLEQHLAEFEFSTLRSEVLDAAREWSRERALAGRRPWGARQWRPALRRAITDPAGFVAAIATSLDQGYEGLASARGAPGAQPRKSAREQSDEAFYAAWDQYLSHPSPAPPQIQP
jgi:hypothetical protein